MRISGKGCKLQRIRKSGFLYKTKVALLAQRTHKKQYSYNYILIHTFTAFAIAGKQISKITFTLIGARHVQTLSVFTHRGDRFAFVDIATRIVPGTHVPLRAFAGKIPVRVGTDSVLTTPVSLIPSALVDVLKKRKLSMDGNEPAVKTTKEKNTEINCLNILHTFCPSASIW